MGKHFDSRYNQLAWLHNGDGIDRDDINRFRGTRVSTNHNRDPVDIFIRIFGGRRGKMKEEILDAQKRFEKPSLKRHHAERQAEKDWRKTERRLRKQGRLNDGK